MGFYLMDGVFSLRKVLFLATPIWAFVILIVLVLHGKKAVVKRHLFIKEYIFATYLLFLAEVTGFFDWGVDKIFGATFNFMPFTDMDLSQVILNVVLFVPLGFMVPMIFRSANTAARMIMVTVLSSMTIESVQFFFLGRTADIDDIITNVLGGIGGYLLYLAVSKLLNRHEKERDAIKETVYLNSIPGMSESITKASKEPLENGTEYHEDEEW